MEIEKLLKKGILGLINDENNENKVYMEEDIDKILENSRIAKYSLINGSFSFSKSSFVSKQTDTSINIDDPNFWETILKNKDSQSKVLLKTLESSSKTFEEQKEFMFKLSVQVNNLIESKLHIIGYNADEESIILEILNKVYTSSLYHKNYKNIATQWLYEISRPSRRFKKLGLHDFEIDGVDNERIIEKKTRNKKNEVEDDPNSSMEQIYDDEVNEDEENDLLDYEENYFEDDNLNVEKKKRISNKERGN